MNRIIAALILFALFSVAPFAANKWTVAHTLLKDAVVFLEHCSGFMIDSEKHHVLTAAHCDVPEGQRLLVNGTFTYRIFKDARKDLMVVRAPGVEAGSLKLAEREPEVGDEVASFGYGYALEQPMFRITHIAHANLEIESLSGPFVAGDTAFVGGQSGGPWVNEKGEVIGIVQRSAAEFGIGVGVATLKDRVGKYFAKVE